MTMGNRKYLNAQNYLTLGAAACADVADGCCSIFHSAIPQMDARLKPSTLAMLHASLTLSFFGVVAFLLRIACHDLPGSFFKEDQAATATGSCFSPLLSIIWTKTSTTALSNE
jgi:hypothetical protein